MLLKGRVIAGKYRHRPLLVLANEQTRTTKDRVKEGMFSALQNNLEGAVVLDLFAGSGSLGIEALSRGAKKAVFVEKNNQTAKTLKDNLAFVVEETEVYIADYTAVLQRIATKSVDIVLLDPPYEFNVEKIMTDIITAEILNENYIIVIESDKPFVGNINNVTMKSYRYGITFVTIIRGENL